jgi:uncharacterized membrane protein
METIPDFWRTEVFHALSVHFPIVLLFFATIFKLLSFFFRKLFFTDSAALLLILGTLGVWIAMYTGDLADGVVARQLCDPTILKDHENMAWITAWLFTSATGIEIFSRLKKIIKFPFFKIIQLFIMLAGTVVLLYVGHLGATLVYQQGAGVYHPMEDCKEF